MLIPSSVGEKDVAWSTGGYVISDRDPFGTEEARELGGSKWV